MDLAHLWFGRRLPSLEQQVHAAEDLGFHGLGLLQGGVEVDLAAIPRVDAGNRLEVAAFHLGALEGQSTPQSPAWSQISIPGLLTALKRLSCSQLIVPCGLDQRPEVRERAAKLENRVSAGERVDPSEEALEQVLVMLEQAREVQLERLAAFLYDLRKAAPGLAIALQPEASAAGLLDPTRFGLLLAEIPDLGIGYWHDTGVAEIRRMGGLEEPGAWLDGYANILQGSTLHDFVGGATLQPPGLGQVEWELLREYLPRSANQILALAPSYPSEVLAEARAALQTRLSA
jgi:hypothetical protein